MGEKLFSPSPRRFLYPRVHHILAIACTGHGASLAYMDDHHSIRCSVLDRWVGVKNAILFSREEEKVIRNPKTKTDQMISDVFRHGFGKFPESRIFEELLSSWVEWLLDGLNVTVSDIDLVVTSDSHFATNCFRLGFDLNSWFPGATIFRAIEHHEIHQRQAFWQSGFKQAAVLTLDFHDERSR
jgi:carbamoyltransferase